MHVGEGYEYFTAETLNVSDINMDIPLNQGEYRIYADVELETPEIGTDINEDPIATYNALAARIFPNPSSAMASLEIELEESASIEVSIYNLLGSEILCLENRMYPEGKQLINLDVSALKRGIYFCNIISDESRDTIKFIKQ